MSCYGDWEAPDTPSDGSEPPGDTTQVGECCGQTYKLTANGVVSSPTYLWLGLVKQDSLYTWGDSVYVGSGSFDGTPLSLHVSGWNQIPEGEYEVRLYGSKSAQEVGSHRLRAIEGEGMRVQVPSLTYEDCPSCCRHPYGRNGRFYCRVIYDVGNAVAASAVIKTRLGKLCGQGYPDTEDTGLALSNASVSLIKDTSTSAVVTRFSQTGYKVVRWDPTKYPTFVDTTLNGLWKYDTGIYVEYSRWIPATNSYQIGFYMPQATPAPTQGSTHHYEVRSNALNGEQYWLYDNDTVIVGLDSGRINIGDRFVSWAGEIAGLETDMPGTESDRCEFTYCNWYHRSYPAIPQNPLFGLGSGDTALVSKYRNTTRWRMHVDTGGSSFQIWDSEPLP